MSAATNGAAPGPHGGHPHHARPGVLSPHEASVLVGLTDSSDAAHQKPLRHAGETFAQSFADPAARVRAIFAIRVLLGVEFDAACSTSQPTSPETIALLFVLHAAATDAAATADARDFAAAGLYEHLLRVEDCLRDDSLLTEQRRYRATAAVGKKSASTAHDAAEKDAYRGHLLQKLFVVQCALGAADASQTAAQLCASAGSVEQLEAAVAAWGAPAGGAASEAPPTTTRQAVVEAVARLRKAWDKEVSFEAATASSAAAGGFAIGYQSRAVPMLSTDATGLAAALRQSKRGPKSTLAEPLDASLAPVASTRPPPRGSVAADARLLLPTASPLLLDAAPHPPEWREARAIVDTAVASGDLSSAQLQKLSAVLSASAGAGAGGSGSSGGGAPTSPNGVKSGASAGGGSGAAGGGAASSATPLFAVIGITPAAFGVMARSNPKAAVIVAQRLDRAWSDAYVAQLVDFNAERPDCPSVLLAASRCGLLTPSLLAAYVARAKAYVAALPSDQHRVDFLKQYAVSLHQVAEKSPLDGTDRATITNLLAAHGDALSDVAKLWNA
jgi:hypothetical protein